MLALGLHNQIQIQIKSEEGGYELYSGMSKHTCKIIDKYTQNLYEYIQKQNQFEDGVRKRRMSCKGQCTICTATPSMTALQIYLEIRTSKTMNIF